MRGEEGGIEGVGGIGREGGRNRNREGCGREQKEGWMEEGWME